MVGTKPFKAKNVWQYKAALLAHGWLWSGDREIIAEGRTLASRLAKIKNAQDFYDALRASGGGVNFAWGCVMSVLHNRGFVESLP